MKRRFSFTSVVAENQTICPSSSVFKADYDYEDDDDEHDFQRSSPWAATTDENIPPLREGEWSFEKAPSDLAEIIGQSPRLKALPSFPLY